jgi:aspartate 4-decarboxylase
MDLKQFSELMNISPFEVKDVLIDLAESHAERMMLNAGRGNPNWVATVPRHAFWQLGRFATLEAERFQGYMREGVGGLPEHDGIVARFDTFVQLYGGEPGVDFLRAAVAYVRDRLGYPADDFLHEMACGILACNYPVPDRMLRLTEAISREYLLKEMCQGSPVTGGIDLFAVEGGTAAMAYIFNSLKANRILRAGDKVAIARPIFTPYLEIPELEDYGLEEVFIDADENDGWQLPDSELEKLRDPAVKAFFLVNPSNPPSVQVGERARNTIAGIIEKDRPDLLLLTDDVYGTFVDGFVSMFAVCPRNTLLVYSYSKYFGATGWRLGVIALHEDNVLDRRLRQLPEDDLKALDRRYASLTTEPRKLKMIDRLVADSRSVALNHTAGLSTPQQVQMALFSLFSLMDTADAYKAEMKRLVRDRVATLYRAVGLVRQPDPDSASYYEELTLDAVGGELYGEDFVQWMTGELAPGEVLYRIADEAGVVLMPGRGFGDTRPSARVSLANLNESDYAAIGKAIRNLLDDYYARFQQRNA